MVEVYKAVQQFSSVKLVVKTFHGFHTGEYQGLNDLLSLLIDIAAIVFKPYDSVYDLACATDLIESYMICPYSLHF